MAEVAAKVNMDLKRKHDDDEELNNPTLKQPKLHQNNILLGSENGEDDQAEKTTEAVNGEDNPSVNNTETEVVQQTSEEPLDAPKETAEEGLEAPKETPVETSQQTTKEAPEGVDAAQIATDDQQVANINPPVGENSQLGTENKQEPKTENQEPSAEESKQVEDGADASELSRKMEVPNDKVGVLIGKGGETIRYLQFNSGAKIQIMRDADVAPQSVNRPVELIGGLENINKAEKLIRDVIAEADAGGSPALVARGFSTAQAAGAVEQVLIQVPNEKVGVIIGKGGDTIKNLQTRSGARIQLIPQHLPDGDQSKERTVRVSGDKKQIERAREMIKEVMSQPPRQTSSLGYNQQQSFRPLGPSSQQQWGSRGPNASHDYQQRGPYNSQPHGYGNYSPHAGPRGNYGSGWEQRPPSMQGPPHHGAGGGYDHYGGQGPMGGPTGPHSNAHPGHGPGPNHSNMGPPSLGNYGQPGSYPLQGYSQGYGENKYENQGPGHQQPYGAPQPQYGKAPPSYGAPPQGPPAQNYVQPRPGQPGDVPYQGGPTQQPYGQNAPPTQQSYPYAAAGGQVPPSYPPYAPAPGAEGYIQQQPAPGAAPMYPQQTGQPIGQQAPGYAQVAGYGSYPVQQQGYADPAAQSNAAYGYQGADPSYGGAGAYGAPVAGQAVYAPPVPAQPVYDQSVPNPGGYGGVPAGYGKGVPPQPGYDATQMYGAAPAPKPAPR